MLHICNFKVLPSSWQGQAQIIHLDRWSVTGYPSALSCPGVRAQISCCNFPAFSNLEKLPVASRKSWIQVSVQSHIKARSWCECRFQFTSHNWNPSQCIYQFKCWIVSYAETVRVKIKSFHWFARANWPANEIGAKGESTINWTSRSEQTCQLVQWFLVAGISA